MTNLIIAYDLDRPGQDYSGVHSAIKALGRWYQLQQSLFYVQTQLSSQQAYDRVRIFMDANDKLLVADASYAVIGNYPLTDLDALQDAWAAA